MRPSDLVADLASTPGLDRPEYRDGAGTAVDIVDVVHDSRQAGPGAMFCAVRGLSVDGHDFAEAALANGAAALLVEHWVDSDRPQIKVSNVRTAMPLAAAIVHGHPSSELAVFGITGTNGKTTTTELLAGIMRAAGRRTEVVGTLAGAHTTPEGTDLQRQLRAAVDAGVEVIAAEVSSHALAQHRVDGTAFAVAAFSNLTPDHLDYHGDLDHYFEAKCRLFDGRAQHELINVDDPWGARLADDRQDAKRITLSDVQITEASLSGSAFSWRGLPCYVPLPGSMNVANALMALEAARCLGVDENLAVDGLAAADEVPGRMQIVESATSGSPTVIVDYSHTPAGIENALMTISALAPGAEVFIVFGCGGDRDRAKRPLMGRAAEQGADRVFVTSDNPRSEAPMKIIEDALAGMNEPDRAVVDQDRRSAITSAIHAATAADVVLIAGKGHERTQTIGRQVLPFDDVTVASEALREVGR